MPDFYINNSFFYNKSNQARVPTFVYLFRDDATTAKGPGCDEGTNFSLRDFGVVLLMPTRVLALSPAISVKMCIALSVHLVRPPDKNVY